MDKDTFRQYLLTRKKVEKDFQSVKTDPVALEQEYQKYRKSQDRANTYAKQYHKERMEYDDDYKAKRVEYNRKAYEKLKAKRSTNKTNSSRKLAVSDDAMDTSDDNSELIEKVEKLTIKEPKQPNKRPTKQEPSKLEPMEIEHPKKPLYMPVHYGLGF